MECWRPVCIWYLGEGRRQSSGGGGKETLSTDTHAHNCDGKHAYALSNLLWKYFEVPMSKTSEVMLLNLLKQETGICFASQVFKSGSPASFGQWATIANKKHTTAASHAPLPAGLIRNVLISL